MSLSANLGRSINRTIPALTANPIHAPKAFISNDLLYGATLPDVEAANIPPFTMVNTTTYQYKKRQSTSVGVPGTTASFQKFENEPLYLLHREMTGFNEWSKMKAIADPEVGVVENPYTKLYIRDPTTGQAVMPKSFEGKLTHDELQTVLQKADHYFFQDRPGPPIQLYVPIKDPRITKPQSQLAKIAEAIDRASASNANVYDNGTTFNNDDEMFRYLDKQFDQIYERGTKPDIYNTNSNSRDAGSISAFSLTAQQRRAEFWRKYLDLFNYYDLLHTCTVRVTRATGRVSTPIALVIMGNCHGIFTYGRGKASTFDLAMRRALMRTRRNVLFTPLHENRTAYYGHLGVYKATQLHFQTHRRGVGIRAGPLTFNLLRAVGYQDATLKLIGSRNMWNVVRAWMQCLQVQESYREIAFARGAHYQQMLDPFRKNPPALGRDDVRDLEDAAATAFEDAVKTVFKNRQLLNTDTFKELDPHFSLRDNFEKKWERHLKDANVPEQFHMYPAFSEYLDAAASLKAIEAVDKAGQVEAKLLAESDPHYIRHTSEIDEKGLASLDATMANLDPRDFDNIPRTFNKRAEPEFSDAEVDTLDSGVPKPVGNLTNIDGDPSTPWYTRTAKPLVEQIAHVETMFQEKENISLHDIGVIPTPLPSSVDEVAAGFVPTAGKSAPKASYYTPVKGERISAIYDASMWPSKSAPTFDSSNSGEGSAPITPVKFTKDVNSDLEK